MTSVLVLLVVWVVIVFRCLRGIRMTRTHGSSAAARGGRIGVRAAIDGICGPSLTNEPADLLQRR